MIPIHERPWLGCAAALATIVFASGCPDPDGRFDSFSEDFEKTKGSVTSTCGDPCTAPAVGEMDGSYLFTLSPPQSPDKPAPFLATVVTSESSAGAFDFTLALTPLDAEDRVTEVGAPIHLGPFTAGHDGGFEADFGSISIPGETNPITPSDLTADVVLCGTMCGGESFCGIAEGRITDPVDLDIKGSHFFFEKGPPFSEPPTLNCAGDTAAPF